MSSALSLAIPFRVGAAARYNQRVLSLDNDRDDDTELDQAPKTARARRWCVIFWNDDYTTKWFVVHVLEQFFHMNEDTASAFMMAVHKEGRGCAGIFTRDVAETKATHIMDYAKEFQMPLMVTAEPDEDDGEDKS